MEDLRIRRWIWVLMILIQIHGYKCCLENERMGLLEFKRFLKSNDEDADRLLPSWVDDDKESDCCRWERVVCNSTSAAVTNLSLNNVPQIDYFLRVYGYSPRKTWSLNVSLFHPFQQLLSLDLSENWFSGSLQNQGMDFLPPSGTVLCLFVCLDIYRFFFLSGEFNKFLNITFVEFGNI